MRESLTMVSGSSTTVTANSTIVRELLTMVSESPTTVTASSTTVYEDYVALREEAENPVPGFVRRLYQEFQESREDSQRMLEAYFEGPEAVEKERQRIIDQSLEKLRDEVRALPIVATLDKAGKAVVKQEEGNTFAANMQAGRASVQLVEDVLVLLTARWLGGGQRTSCHR